MVKSSYSASKGAPRVNILANSDPPGGVEEISKYPKNEEEIRILSFRAISLIKKLITRSFFIFLFIQYFGPNSQKTIIRNDDVMEWPSSSNQFSFTSKNHCNVFALAKRPWFDVKYGTNVDWYVNYIRTVSTIPSERLGRVWVSWWTAIHWFFACICCCIHSLWFWSRSSRLSDFWFCSRG